MKANPNQDQPLFETDIIQKAIARQRVIEKKSVELQRMNDRIRESNYMVFANLGVNAECKNCGKTILFCSCERYK